MTTITLKRYKKAITFHTEPGACVASLYDGEQEIKFDPMVENARKIDSARIPDQNITAA